MTNCHLFNIFNTTTDTEELAKYMYSVTGNIPMNYKMNGEWERLPVTAEVNRNLHNILSLQHRQYVQWEKEAPVRARTFDMPIPNFHTLSEAEAIAWNFESEHLHLTGRPDWLIKQELEAHRAEVYEKIGWKPLLPKVAPKPQLPEPSEPTTKTIAFKPGDVK